MNLSENSEIKFEFIVKAKIADKEIHHIDFTFDDLEKCDFSLYDFMYERLESISAEYCGCSISEGNPHCDCDGGGWDGDWEIVSRRQYTGSKDKNSVEIYKGDILNHNDIYYVVDFEEGCYILTDKHRKSKRPLSALCYAFMIVGNEFENNDLLMDTL